MAATPGGERRGRFVVFQITFGTPVRTEGWCQHCLVPSLVAVPMLSVTDAGVSDMGTVTVCSDCLVPQQTHLKHP